MYFHFTFELLVLLFFLAMGHGVLSTIIAKREIVIVWTRRIAAIAFLGWVLWHGCTQAPRMTSGWMSVLLNGLLFAWVAMCGSRLVALVGGVFYDLLFHPLTRPIHAFIVNSHDAGLARRREIQRLSEAPARERVLALQAQEVAAAQRSRDDARASVYLLYSFYAPTIGDRFTRADVDRYVESFMNDSQSPDAVERRGRELLAILERHVAEVDPFAHGANLESLILWRDEEFRRLEALPVDEALKDEYGVLLRRRFDEIFKRSIKEIRP